VSVDRDDPPYKVVGALFLAITVVAGSLLFLQFRGHFAATSELTLLAARAGLESFFVGQRPIVENGFGRQVRGHAAC